MFRILLCIALLIPFKEVLAQQLEFIDHLVMNETYAPMSVEKLAAADLDGDGDLDIVSASYGDNKIAWYEYRSDLDEFMAPRIISNNLENASFVLAADLDNDGDIDLATAAYNEITWYENADSLGTFSEHAVSSEVIGAESVFATDLDGDGDIDLLSSSQVDDKIAWYENTDGLGTFGPQIIINIENDYPHFVTAGDIDGDGDEDVISVSSFFSDNKLAWYENTDGQGTFGPRQLISSSGGNGFIEVYTADLDGDNDLDVLTVSEDFNGIRWFENLNSAGNFSSDQILTTNSVGASSAHPFDMDGDSDLDIIATYNNDITAWHENIDGNGNFSAEIPLLDPAYNKNNLISADINQDGFEDLIFSSRVNDEISWLKASNGTGDFFEDRIIVARPKTTFAIQVSDIDGDNQLDILSTSNDDGKIAWYKNLDGEGFFSSQRIINRDTEGPWDFDLGDIDGDGDLDILCNSSSEGLTAWYEHLDGQANFSPPIEIDTNGSVPHNSKLIDLDQDGDLDVIQSPDLFTISWYENLDGQGSFSNANVITTEVIITNDIFAVDLDGDNDLDIVSGSSNDNKLAWYENLDGQGNFGAQQIIFIGDHSVNDLFPEDVDGDGDMDLVSSTIWGTLFFHENLDGQGNFASAQIIDTDLDTIESIISVDIDNDGDKDIAIAIWGTGLSGYIGYYENLDGQGNFSDLFIVASQSPSNNMMLKSGDINNDGHSDLVCVTVASDKIVWYENTGVLNITDFEKESSTIILSPVPADQTVSITSESPLKNITIYNVLGQVVLTTSYKKEIDVSTFFNGIYLIKTEDENGMISSNKFIVQHQ